MNQVVPPKGELFGGRPWQSVGVFSVAGNALWVQLTDKADGRVIADGVRLVPVRNDVQVLSLEKSLTNESVTARVAVKVVVPQ